MGHAILTTSMFLASAGAQPRSEDDAFVALLLQLVVILGATRLVVVLARRVGQTDVIGEVLAGLILGPSLLGALAPGLLERLFPSDTMPALSMLSSLGLVLLMFQLGTEFELRKNLATTRLAVLFTSVGGIAAPFALGYLSAPWIHAQLGAGVGLEGFRWFFAIALSITAIPVLGRIFLELNLSHTRTASITMSSAAVEDVVGWILLGAVSFAAAEGSATWVAERTGALAAYLGVLLLVVRPLLGRYIRAYLRAYGQLRHTAVGVVLVLLFCSAAFTTEIGIHALLGGFALGAALHDQRRFVAEWKTRVAPLVNVLLLPVFFAYTGLRTDVGLLADASDLALCAAVVALAVVGKVGGCFAAARLAGEPQRVALTIAVCMNTRGLVELVVVNVGYELGFIPREMFTMLVLMAIVTTMATTPLIRRLMADERRPGPARVGSGTIQIQLAEHAVQEHAERARQGIRHLLDGMLVDRGAADRLGGLVGELVDTAAALVPELRRAAPRVALELHDGKAHVRVAISLDDDAGRASARSLELLQRAGAERLEEVARRSGCRVHVAATHAELCLDAELELQGDEDRSVR